MNERAEHEARAIGHDAPLAPILVVMALRSEGAGVFEQASVPVLYCGVGKVNAAIALTRELTRYSHAGRALPLVLNFGTAGSREHAPGTLVACREFVQRDMDVSGLGFPLGVTPFEEGPAGLKFDSEFPELPSAVCGTGDSFATGAWAGAHTLVDMEAYALAKVCWIEGARFGCVKFISDGADHTAADDWRDNVHKAAEEFLRVYRRVAET
jgi:adenosylhomocysteine nucleosidase